MSFASDLIGLDGTPIAEAILAGFDKHYRLFRAISTAAKDRFERADWKAVRAAHRERIEMYDRRVAEAVLAVREQFPQVHAESEWPSIKHAYVTLLLNHQQPECAETFFNSVARRLLDRRYYSNDCIFSRPAMSTEHIDGEQPTYRCYYPDDPELGDAFRAILEDFGLKNQYFEKATCLRENAFLVCFQFHVDPRLLCKFEARRNFTSN